MTDREQTLLKAYWDKSDEAESLEMRVTELQRQLMEQRQLLEQRQLMERQLMEQLCEARRANKEAKNKIARLEHPDIFLAPMNTQFKGVASQALLEDAHRTKVQERAEDDKEQ
ncbi:hypothetical protein TSOC_014541 [Tetrabaena socialis]|uniref:Uncharacterized protein n=1 Tax=Tetrabaena socialis TaxID=47790 RepID=A0A2J7ZHD9_9CHLO|nr:hypothetical protein TSOC_014541 [Tetrabaena socialis]|eukprot:PNG99674.1 hypothetical protein TSOC_014541 [Tetrabaena socialis]